MPGEGSILGMIISYRENMRLRKKSRIFSKKDYFDQVDLRTLSNSHLQLDVRKLSEEELNIYKEKAIRSRKRNNRILLLTILLITVPVSLLVFKVSNLIIKGDSHVESRQMPMEVREDKFYFYLTDADHWAEQNNWNNAIYQYKNAVNLSPNNYLANYRLARAYVYNCKLNGESCDEAISQLNKLIELFPEKASLYHLRAEHYNNISMPEMADADYEKEEMLLNAE